VVRAFPIVTHATREYLVRGSLQDLSSDRSAVSSRAVGAGRASHVKQIR
jgi:hypothetical protein